MRCLSFFMIILLTEGARVVWTKTIPAVDTVEIPKNSTPCSIQVGKLCPTIDEDLGNYTIDIGTHFFRESRELQVKIHSTNCPWHVEVSPWWYQLNVVKRTSRDAQEDSDAGVSNRVTTSGPDKTVDEQDILTGTDSGEGAFLQMRPNHEIQLCDSNKRVVFTSCSPSPMDFPVMFIWKASADYNVSDTICFKLILKQDGNTACKQIKVCRSIAQLLTNATNSFTVVSNRPERDNITLEDIIGGNSESQPGSDNMRKVLDIDMSQAGETTMSMSGCMSTKKFLHDNGISWEPACDCQGHYKLIQCLNTEYDRQVCWCSSRGGSEKFNTRRTLTCSTAMDFEC